VRTLFGVLCVCALAGLPLVGCGDSDGGGGSGGEGGTGGAGGAAGNGGTGGVGGDCTGAEDGTECALGESFGSCFDGTCHVEDCSAVDDGTDCIDLDFVGLCFGGSCMELLRCEDNFDCSDYSDCTSQSCLTNGLCEDGGALEDGTPCAGGTCQGGECVLESSVLPCSEQGIRNAIAAGDGPYTFDCGGPKNVVTQAKIGIYNDVILDGEGMLTVDGGNAHPVFGVDDGVTAELRGLTIINGVRGIEVNGYLVLVRSEVRDCGSEEQGGGIFNGGGGALLLIDSTVSGNESEDAGGGIRNSGDGGAILVNSTVSGNSAREGGGIHSDLAPLTLINSTISGNSAERGSGIFHTDQDEPNSVVEVVGTLVEGDCVIEGGATLASNGYNIETPGDTCGFDQASDQVNVTGEQLNLGPLQDNGGPTMTHALGAGSVAIDQIPAEDCLDAEGQPLTTDQRGEPRPETGGTMCDVGAFEVQP
jgi:hypothetical protein